MRRKHLKYAVTVDKFINDDGDLEFVNYKEFQYKKEAMDFINSFLNSGCYYIKFYYGNEFEVFE